MRKPYKNLAIPYIVWLYLFAVLPVAFMLVLSFMKSDGVDLNGARFTLSNFAQLGEKSTWISFVNSLWISIVSTFISIVLGYLVAYRLFRSKMKNKLLILTILVLPMWCNILLRTEALANIFQHQNILSDLLSKIGLKLDLDIRGSYLAVIIGLVLTYMPYMIMPIYNALEKIDKSIDEAAYDLGLNHFQRFVKITLPLSMKGIVAGTIMTLLPSISGFAIPEILGDGNIVMIGNVINQLFNDMNYNIGSLLGILIVAFIMVAIAIINKIDKEGNMLV